VQCLAIQPDGKILVGGWFSNLGGQTRNCLGRLNADGTLDAAFDPGGFQRVNSLVVQADGKILVGQDQDGNGIVRLNPDGTFDMTFNPIARYSVRMIALQRDGKILVAGRLIHLAGKPMRGIGRLNADGTFDPTFDASVQGEIRIIAVLPSGRILVGGDLSLVDDQPRSELARLNCDGSLDATFGPAADQSVECFLPQSDGHILVGGYFTMIAGQSRTNFARLIAPESPVVTVSPPAMTAERASSATFTAKAATYPPANYQWLFNGAPLGGATNAALQLTDLQFAQAGAYSVVASNFAGLGVSSSCLLQVIPAVDRRPVPALLVGGEAGNFIHLEYAASPATPAWLPLETATLTSTQFVFDISSPMSSARFYRAWQTNVQSAKPSLQILGLVTKLTLTGSIGSNVRIDYIAQFGPTDAWVNLDTVTLTNTSQPYFDLTMLHQPARLYRLVPVP
jgi:uncharacterized delta-60 repeat protein